MGLYRVTITKQVERLVEAEQRSDLTGEDASEQLIGAVVKDDSLKSAPMLVTVGRGAPEDSDLEPDLVFTRKAHLQAPPPAAETENMPAEAAGGV